MAEKITKRVVVEALIAHNIRMYLYSLGRGNHDTQVLSKGFHDALFNSTSIKEYLSNADNYFPRHYNKNLLLDIIPSWIAKDSQDLQVEGVAEKIMEHLHDWGVIKSVLVARKDYPARKNYDGKLLEAAHSQHYFGFLLNKEEVSKVMDETSYAISDFFTGARDMKETALSAVEIRSLWDIMKNPKSYGLNNRGGLIYRKDKPPVRGKGNEAQVLNLARALVSKDFLHCLTTVLGRDMKVACGYTEDILVPLTREQADTLGATRAFRWYVRDPDTNPCLLVTDRCLAFKFTPTKETEMELTFKAVNVIKAIHAQVNQAMLEQTSVLEELFNEHGKDTNKWVADKLAEKMSENPMAFINDPFYQDLATLGLGG